MGLVEKLREIRERLKDPFNCEGLAEEFEELEEMLKEASKEEALKAYPKYEEVKRLFFRNLELFKKLYEVG